MESPAGTAGPETTLFFGSVVFFFRRLILTVPASYDAFFWDTAGPKARDGVRLNPATNNVVWTFALAPGETRRVPFEYSIEAPLGEKLEVRSR